LPGHAKDLGVKHAGGFVAFIDAECVGATFIFTESIGNLYARDISKYWQFLFVGGESCPLRLGNASSVGKREASHKYGFDICEGYGF